MTIVEALAAATAALNNAVTKVLGVYDLMVQLKATTTASTTTIVNNFLNRPPSAAFYVDAALGSDANDGLSLATPFKTLDAAIAVLPRDGFSTVYVLTDVVLNGYYNQYSPITVFGIQRGNGANGATFSPYLRRLTFASEAANSPVAGVGRVTAGFNVVAPYIRYQFVDTMVGDPVAGVDVKYHHQLQGATLQMTGCAINAPTSASLASLLSASDGAQSHLWFSGSVGPNAPGHIVAGKAAGANPNTGFAFETNLSTV